MADKYYILYTCTDLYQQGVGATWENLVYARTGDGYGSYVYPKGKNDKTEYKPKDLCYIYNYTLDTSHYKLQTVYFTIVFRYHNTAKFNFPKIRVYTGRKGDNTFIKEVTTYTKMDNRLELDNYTIRYAITGLTPKQLQSLLIKVVWDKNKTNESAKISINRARLNIHYKPLEPKFSLYSSPSDVASANNHDDFIWTLTAKNTGDCGRGYATISLPTGATLVGSSGGGSFNPSTNVWTFDLCNNQSAVRSFRLKFAYVGRYYLTATNNSPNKVNNGVNLTVNVEQWYPSPSDERIVITPYESFAFERGYFDVGVYGVYNGESVHCYDLDIPTGLNVEVPYRDTIIDLQNDTNINHIIRSDDAEVVITEDNRICVKVNNTMSNFEFHIRVPFYATDEGTYQVSVTSLDSDKTYTGNIFILEKRGMNLQTSSALSRDKRYVYNSLNIGSPHIWTVRAKASRYNFFDEMDDLLSIDIEPMIAYIGVIPLSRCHKADVTADSKNTLIENRYLNRAYYGKKGDYSESIKMTLRMPWQDVATLQGLCEMDKPIPIDTIPTRADGDPLNHRGWAELTGVTNIKKINDLYYECDVEVTYLTHKLLTKFGVTEGAKITANSISYYLDLVHDYGDDILDLFAVSYYQFFTVLEDTTGNYVGTWDIEPQTDLTLYSKTNVNEHSTWDIKFRNHLPVLMSEDFDGNWEMALRLKNAKNDDLIFEHFYNNFRHYDFENNRAINSADVSTTIKRGNTYETINYDKIGLGYDSTAPLVEDRKIATHFNTMENTTISAVDEDFEIFLLDSNNNGIANQVVKVTLESADGFRKKFNVMSDTYGRILFELKYGNGDFTITLDYEETEKYRDCSYSTDLNVNFDYEEYHFSYPNEATIYEKDYEYIVTLLDSQDDVVPNRMLHYSFRTATGDYGYERTLVTDENGQIKIPINWFNGSNTIRVVFKGLNDNGVIYQPVQFEAPINIYFEGKDTVIEADDVVGILGYSVPSFSCILKDGDGNPLANKTIRTSYYNNKQSIIRSETTNNFGSIGLINIDLIADAWRIDLHFRGDDEYKPCVKTINVSLENFEQLDSYMVTENYVLNEDDVRNGELNYYTINLLDVYANPIANEPVSIKIYRNDDFETPVVDMVLKTDDDGKIEVPYLDHDCNATVIAEYKGCTRYAPCSNEDIITFEEVSPKGDVEFRVHSSNTFIEVKYGSGEWKGIWNDNRMERVIVNHPNDYRYVVDGMYYYYSMDANEYKVTLFYKGNENFYAKTETLVYNKVDDSRKTIDEWIALQPNATSNSTLTTGRNLVGFYAILTIDVDFEVPYDLFTIHMGGEANNGVVDMTNVESSFRVVPHYYQADDGHTKTRFSFINIVPNNGKICIINEGTDYTYPIYYNLTISPLFPTTNQDVTLTQTGFAYENQTLQNISVLTHNSNAKDTDLVNNWFVMKLINIETFEELEFRSYLLNNVTPVTMQFGLSKSLYNDDNNDNNNWELQITGKNVGNYNGSFLCDVGRIDTDTEITPTMNDISVTSDKFVEKEESIDFDETGFGFFWGGFD